jgi:Phosphoesterase family
VAKRQVITQAYVAGGATGNPQTPATPAQALAGAAAEVVRRQLAQGSRASIIVTPTAAVVTTPTPLISGNLLANPGGEIGDPSLSGYSSVTIPGWQVTGTPTVIQYGTQRRLPGLFGTKGLLLPKFLSFPQTAPATGDNQFFGGGNVATSSLTQTVDFGTNAGGLDFALSADLGGYLIDPSRASVKVDFLDANKGFISSAEIKPVTALGRLLQTGLETRSISGVIPDGAQSAQVTVTLKDLNPVLGNYNNAYADNISFSVGSAAYSAVKNVVTVPTPNVGTLDHVFLVYMENHGTNDIIGSPNAPYINSLVNAYGYAQNYYALTHPSMPNYWPILGGSDFGFNYNCASQCVNEPNLITNNPNLTWAAYQQGGGGYSDPQDRTPFLAFTNIYNDPTTAAKIKDIGALTGDLNDPLGNVAQFNWIAADEASNMEGPIDSIPGILNFALSQLTTHQYNVAAGDQFVQQQLSTIMNSYDWQNSKSAIFLTFDEDYNNISWGIGNEGNHVVTVVIPSPDAVTSGGMKGGAFVASDYYNHYSLQRTIELALNLQPLTKNDEYAQPMNDFWT